MPSTYESSGTILVESQKIAAEPVQALINGIADERVEIIKQRLLSRENLLSIADATGLAKRTGSLENATALIDGMRANMHIELIGADLGLRGSAGSIVFKLSYEHQNPEAAYRVANGLVTWFLNENARIRTERGSEAMDFFAREADRLKSQLDELETRAAAFKEEHGLSVVGDPSLNAMTVQQVETDLAEVDRQYRTAQDDLRSLEVELAAAKAGVVEARDVEVLNPLQELQKLRTEFEGLSGIYTKDHPDIRMLAQRIRVLETLVGNAAIAAPGAIVQATPASAADVALTKIATRISSANFRIASLSEQRHALRARLDELQDRIARAPQLERQLAAIMRDHEQSRSIYEEIRSRQMQVQITQNLEQLDNGDRFSLLEAPLIPEKPAAHNRKKFLAFGFVISLVSAVVPAVLVELIRGRVYGRGALTSILGAPPLVVIPYIRAPKEASRRGDAGSTQSSCATVLALYVSAALLHFASVIPVAKAILGGIA
jgi:polysaccharide chain length determinant protein (PEP-CTERM system associated)